MPGIATGDPGPATPPAWGEGMRVRLQLLLLLAVCAAVYWPWLGAAGLTSTEGHRAIPGWTMLESGDWLRVSMFELGYLRKPPGMPWAVAASSAIFGETEFAARAVSAAATTLTAVLALVFAVRWFGRPWGLAAGLACALMPQLWSPGRAAEIEALNNLGTAAAAFCMIELLLPPAGRRRGVDAALAVLAAVAVVLTALAKGPASVPVLGAVPIAACVAARSVRPLGRPAFWGAAVLSAGALAWLAGVILGANDAEETVRQGVSDFLWKPERVAAILTLAAAAFGAAMPASLALLFPFGPNARAEGAGDARGVTIARALAWAWILALAVYTAAGVSNSRYAMPAAVLLPPLAAYVARGWMGRTPAFIPVRQRIARGLSLGHPAALPVVLLIGAAVYVPLSERYRMRASGREAGREVAAAIEVDRGNDGPVSNQPVVIWADEMIETRPEVLLYASRAAAEGGEGGEGGWGLRPIWAKGAMGRGELPPVGGYLLIKTDNPVSLEPGRFARAAGGGRLAHVMDGEVHKFRFTLYRVAGD